MSRKIEETVEMRIALDIKGTKILLTENEAEALYEKLGLIFGKYNISPYPQYPYIYSPWVQTTNDTVAVTTTACSTANATDAVSYFSTHSAPETHASYASRIF